jgi:hypothetical protein
MQCKCGKEIDENDGLYLINDGRCYDCYWNETSSE